MRRPSKKTNCPACGEPMTVAGGSQGGRVCCPHCRRVVVLPDSTGEAPRNGEIPLLTGVPDPLTAQQLLEEIMRQHQEKRALLDQTTGDLRKLEVRAGLIRQWLEKDTKEAPSVTLLLQFRLFEKLSPLPKGCVEIRQPGLADEDSPDRLLQDCFTALGWEVRLTRIESPQKNFGPVIFSIGPGPMNREMAAVWLALSLAGLHLASLVDQEQENGHVVLMVPGKLIFHPRAEQEMAIREPIHDVTDHSQTIFSADPPESRVHSAPARLG